MTPMRANIVGPPDVAARIKASMAACHSAGIVFGLRKFGYVLAGILERDKLATARQRYRISKRALPAVCCRLAGQCRFSLQPSGGVVRPFRASIGSGIAAVFKRRCNAPA
jgi:hypothetical protein